MNSFVSIEKVYTSGGGSVSPLWRQMQADIFDLPVYTMSASGEGGAYGAILVDGVGAGVWGSLCLLYTSLLGGELLERLCQIVGLLGLENHDIARRMGGTVFPQRKVNIVFLGAGPEQANIRVGDLDVRECRTVLFELPQALFAVVQLGFALLPGGQKFLHGRLQYLSLIHICWGSAPVFCPA